MYTFIETTSKDNHTGSYIRIYKCCVEITTLFTTLERLHFPSYQKHSFHWEPSAALITTLPKTLMPFYHVLLKLSWRGAQYCVPNQMHQTSNM